MNEDDLTQEILFGTPDMTAEEEQQMMLQAEQSQQDMQLMENMARRQMLQQAAQEAAPQQPQGSTQQPAQPTGQEQQQKPKQEGGVDIGGLARQTLEGAMTVPAGIVDFGVDLINLLPSKEVPGMANPFRPDGKVPKLPKFQSDITQTLREISSVVAPTLLLTGIGGGALKGAASASKAKMLQDPFVQWVAPKLFAAGAGAAVDYTVQFNQTDDNLTGTLKKSFPAQFGWIPDNVATLDSDSPDVKRAKNVTEGVGLGLFTDFASLYSMGTRVRKGYTVVLKELRYRGS